MKKLQYVLAILPFVTLATFIVGSFISTAIKKDGLERLMVQCSVVVIMLLVIALSFAWGMTGLTK